MPQPKDDLHFDNPPKGCNGDNTNMIYLININDCVFNNKGLVRIKRKYGKNKREVFKVNKKDIV